MSNREGDEIRLRIGTVVYTIHMLEKPDFSGSIFSLANDARSELTFSSLCSTGSDLKQFQSAHDPKPQSRKPNGLLLFFSVAPKIAQMTKTKVERGIFGDNTSDRTT